MQHLRPTKGLLVGTALSLVAMLLPPASASQRGSEAVVPASVSRSFHVTYSGKPPLQNVVKKTLKGDKTKDGNCIWHPADMTLAPQDRALEQRQISADYANCTTVVEIGNPTSIDPIEADEELATGVRTFSKRRTLARAGSLYNTTQAYYKVTWYDAVNLQLNYVRSILNWTWGQQQCIVGSVASSATWAQEGTGWGRDSHTWWKTTSCTDHRTHTSADFSNPLFCFLQNVRTHYRNVRIRGGYTGTYGAALDSTWSENSCLPLHWGGQVVKEWTTS